MALFGIKMAKKTGAPPLAGAMVGVVIGGVLVVVSIISALILAVFSGWQMKISHMRKSLNFKSEGIYNIWRVAIRILVPLLIVVAIAGWLMS